MDEVEVEVKNMEIAIENVARRRRVMAMQLIIVYEKKKMLRVMAMQLIIVYEKKRQKNMLLDASDMSQTNINSVIQISEG